MTKKEVIDFAKGDADQQIQSINYHPIYRNTNFSFYG
jgi:hypothetical protein